MDLVAERLDHHLRTDHASTIAVTRLCPRLVPRLGRVPGVAQCGFTWTADRLLECGEPTWTLERQFNLAAGLTAADDTLPKRLLEDPTPSGSAKGKVNELGKMMPEYYAARGWTTDGVPSNETLSRLKL